jgi:hypothetical protein
MAITFEELIAGLSTDPLTGEALVPDFSKLASLTCGDYQKWLRKQIRTSGRRAVVGNTQQSPVDLFVKEQTGYDFLMLATGEVEVTANSKTYNFMSDAVSLAYYLYDDAGELVTTTGKALQMAMDAENASTLLIAGGE